MNIESSIFGRWAQWSQSLADARVTQVRQKDIFRFEIALQSEKPISLALCLQPIPLIYTDTVKLGGSNETPGRFCMTLRKYLVGARVSAISQVHADKLIRLDFSRIEDGGKIVTRTLFVELIPSMPNLVLTESEHIIDILTSRDLPNRILRPQERYLLPQHSDKMNWADFTASKLSALLDAHADGPLREALFTLFQGLSRPLVRELAAHAQADLDILSWSDLPATARTSVMNCFTQWRTELHQKTKVYFYTQGRKQWCSPFTLSAIDADVVAYPNANGLLAEIALQAASTDSHKHAELRKRIDKLYKHAERKYKKILQEKEEMNALEKAKQYGDLLAIYAYLPTSCRSSVTVDNLLLPDTPPITIPIHPGESMSRNSQRYYRQYARLKRRSDVIDSHLDSAAQECRYLSSLRYFLNEDLTPAELDEVSGEIERQYPSNTRAKPQDRPSADITTLEYDGFRIGIGKNNTQNDRLTMKIASPADLWFHAKELPGSHVILFAVPGQQFTDAAISYAASLAAGHSRAKHDSKVAVDYTLKKYVKKPKNAAPGFVHYTHQQTLVVVPKLVK